MFSLCTYAMAQINRTTRTICSALELASSFSSSFPSLSHSLARSLRVVALHISSFRVCDLTCVCVCVFVKCVQSKYVSSVCESFNNILLQSAKRILRCWRYIKIHHILLRCTFCSHFQSQSWILLLLMRAHIYKRRRWRHRFHLPANFLLKQIDWTIGFSFFLLCLIRSFYLKLLFARVLVHLK